MRVKTARNGNERGVREALLLVDVIKNFLHEDGEALLASFRERHAALAAAIESARSEGVPVIYANDNVGIWDGDAPGLVRQAIEQGKAGELVAAIAPRPGDRFVLKPRYSAFDQTPLELLLRELGVERIRLAGSATEYCVLHSAIAAQQSGFAVTVLPEACATVDENLERIALDYLERVLGVELGAVGTTAGQSPS